MKKKKSKQGFTCSIKAAVAVFSAAALSACGTPGTSQSVRDFDQRVYAGAGLLLSQLEPDASGVANISVDESMSNGGSLFLGYDISNRFSIEGHVADLGASELAPAGTIDYQVGGLSALLYALGDEQNRMRREGFSVFGRLGVGALQNDSDGVEFEQINGVHLLAGAGLEYGLSNGLAARLELVAHETDAKYAQLGLLYRFGTERRRSAPVVEKVVEPTVSEPEIEATPAPLPAPVVSEPVVKRPPADEDADGIPDDIDACANSEPGIPVDDVGCAVFGGVVEGVKFRSGSAELTDDAVVVLSEVAQTLLDNPTIRVAIKAHTDSAGDAQDNLQLSKRRALSVVRYLVDNGIAGSRLRPQAFGESEPREPNLTAEGREANRRVEIEIIR